MRSRAIPFRLDEKMIAQVDRQAKALGLPRSTFIKFAIADGIRKMEAGTFRLPTTAKSPAWDEKTIARVHCRAKAVADGIRNMEAGTDLTAVDLLMLARQCLMEACRIDEHFRLNPCFHRALQLCGELLISAYAAQELRRFAAQTSSQPAKPRRRKP
jgi:predicted DNA-binding protein